MQVRLGVQDYQFRPGASLSSKKCFVQRGSKPKEKIGEDREKRANYFTEEDQRELFKELEKLASDSKDWHEVREDIASRSFRLAWFATNKTILRNPELARFKDDIYSEALLSLTKAISTYDLSKGIPFASWAFKIIFQGLLRFIFKQRKIFNNETTLIDPFMSTAAAYMRIDPAIQAYANDVVERLKTLKNLRQREIIEARFGLNGRRPEELASIARRLRVGRTRISQIYQKGIDRLRKEFAWAEALIVERRNLSAANPQLSVTKVLSPIRILSLETALGPKVLEFIETKLRQSGINILDSLTDEATIRTMLDGKLIKFEEAVTRGRRSFTVDNIYFATKRKEPLVLRFHLLKKVNKSDTPNTPFPTRIRNCKMILSAYDFYTGEVVFSFIIDPRLTINTNQVANSSGYQIADYTIDSNNALFPDSQNSYCFHPNYIGQRLRDASKQERNLDYLDPVISYALRWKDSPREPSLHRLPGDDEFKKVINELDFAASFKTLVESGDLDRLIKHEEKIAGDLDDRFIRQNRSISNIIDASFMGRSR